MEQRPELLDSLQDKIAYGVQYYRAPTPLPGDWPADMEQITALNLRMVQLRVQWRWHERREGEYKFDDLDRLFELAEKNGLQVIVKFLLETAPEWIFHKYQGYRIDPFGQPIPPYANGAFYVGGRQPCFENPAVRLAAEKFVKEVVTRYRDRDSLLLWNMWNEPRCKPMGECACEHSNRRYHAWLRERYGTVEKFNEFFGKAWDEFEYIRPPSSTSDHADMFVWREFMMDMVADRIRWMSELVRGFDSRHPVMTHVGACSPIQDILCDSSDDWLNARAVDFYGSSMPTKGLRGAAPYMADMINDWIRAVSPYYWIHELYACWANWQKRPPPAELRFNVWTSVSRGARGICFWQYKNERFGNESDGFGLVKISGAATARSAEAAKAGARLAQRPDIFGRAVPLPADLAVVYDRSSDLISRLEQANRLNYTINFNQPTSFDTSYIYKCSLQGVYRAAWTLDLPMDFLSSHDLKSIYRYKAVYLPYPIMLGKDTSAILRAYVEQGGTLIAEASPALREENTWVSAVVPGYGLDELFGLREEYRVMPGIPDNLMPISGGGKFNLPNVVQESLVGTAETLAGWESNGQPAVTQNLVGKGRAVLIQSYPGQVYHNEPTTENLRFFDWLFCRQAGLACPMPVAGDHTGIVIRVLTVDTDRLVMVFNYNRQSRKITLKECTLVEPGDLVGDNAAQTGADGLELALAPESVGAWMVKN